MEETLDRNKRKELESSITELKNELASAVLFDYKNALSEIEKARKRILTLESSLRELEEVYKTHIGRSISLDLEDDWTDIALMKFWKEPDFPGWRKYVIQYITEVDSFLSLRDFIRHTGITDKIEVSTLTSAISNALTTSFQNGKLGRISVLGKAGSLYGLPSFFKGEDVKTDYILKLIKLSKTKSVKVYKVEPPILRIPNLLDEMEYEEDSTVNKQ